MTPAQITTADHASRMERLKHIRAVLSAVFPVGFQEENRESQRMMDEAILIVLQTFKHAIETPPHITPDRPIMYLRAFLGDVKPGTFLAYLEPRAREWIQWCKEYEDKQTATARKLYLKAVMMRVGLIGEKR